MFVCLFVCLSVWLILNNNYVTITNSVLNVFKTWQWNVGKTKNYKMYAIYFTFWQWREARNKTKQSKKNNLKIARGSFAKKCIFMLIARSRVCRAFKYTSSSSDSCPISPEYHFVLSYIVIGMDLWKANQIF